MIRSKVIVGPDCIIHDTAEIGNPPEHRDAWETGRMASVVIGERVRINAFCTVDRGWERDTFIGSDSYLLRGVHVGHCAQVGSQCRIHCNAIIGGHVEIGDRVYIGLGAIILPKVKIGEGALVGAGAVVTKDVPPFTKVVGNPARVIGKNEPR